MRELVLIAGIRTPFTGAEAARFYPRIDEMTARLIAAALSRTPGLEAVMVDGLILGSALREPLEIPGAARSAVLLAGLRPDCWSLGVNAAELSSAMAIFQAAALIQSGRADLIVCAGAEVMSGVPARGPAPDPSPELCANFPAALLPTGVFAETLARRYGLTRELQDACAQRLLDRAATPEAVKLRRATVIPLEYHDITGAAHRLEEDSPTYPAAKPLAEYDPAFLAGGTVTRGNLAQPADGAAVVA